MMKTVKIACVSAVIALILDFAAWTASGNSYLFCALFGGLWMKLF